MLYQKVINTMEKKKRIRGPGVGGEVGCDFKYSGQRGLRETSSEE